MSNVFSTKRIQVTANGYTYAQWKVEGRLNGARVRKFFPNKEEAEGYRQLKEVEAINGSHELRPSVTHLTAEQLRQAEAAFKRLGNRSILAAVEWYLDTYRDTLTKLSVTEAYPQFTADRKPHVRQSTIDDYTGSLKAKESAKLYDYPYIGDAWSTGRNLSGTLTTRKWDELNARLGPTKHVNLIVVRLKTPEEARALEAKWIGGKKNDLVLTYGERWSYVFGWTESTLAKTKLESLLRYHYPLDDRFIPEVEKVIVAHYKMVDWHKFDYLDLKPRTAHYWWLALTMFLTQAGAMTFAFMNGANRVRRMRPITYPKCNYV